MFLADPVTIWFRRRSSGSCEDALTPHFAKPRLTPSTDDEDEEEEEEGREGGGEGREVREGEGDAVFSPSPTSLDSPLVTSPCLPFQRGSVPRSTKEKVSKRSSVEKTSKKSGSKSGGKHDGEEGGGAKKKSGPRMLWRSKSSCADSKTAQALASGGHRMRWRGKGNRPESLLDLGVPEKSSGGDTDAVTSSHRHVIRQHTTPTILLVDGDSPHRLERSLSNTGDFRSSASPPPNDSPTSPRPCSNLSLSPPPNHPKYFRSPSLSVSPTHSSSPLSPSPPTARSSTMYAQSLSPPAHHRYHHHHHNYQAQASPPLPQGSNNNSSSSSPFRRKSSSAFPNRTSCFDFEYIPEKLRALQEDWRAHKQHRRQLARQEAKVTTSSPLPIPEGQGQSQQRLSRSSSRSCSRSPRAVSPMPLSYEDYVLYLYSLEGKQ